MTSQEFATWLQSRGLERVTEGFFDSADSNSAARVKFQFIETHKELLTCWVPAPSRDLSQIGGDQFKNKFFDFLKEVLERKLKGELK